MVPGMTDVEKLRAYKKSTREAPQPSHSGLQEEIIPGAAVVDASRDKPTSISSIEEATPCLKKSNTKKSLVEWTHVESLEASRQDPSQDYTTPEKAIAETTLEKSPSNSASGNILPPSFGKEIRSPRMSVETVKTLKPYNAYQVIPVSFQA